MARASRRRPECDVLEQRSLLSGAHAHVAVHHHHHVHAHAAAARAPAVMAVSQAVAGGAVTGGGLLNVGPAPSNADIQSMQQVASTNNMVMFVMQLEVLKSTNTNLQQTAASVLDDARNLDLYAWQTAKNLGINLPADIEGSDRDRAIQVAMAANSSGLDQVALSQLNQSGAGLVAKLQQMQTGAQNAMVQTFATTALPIVQADMAALQAAATGSTTGTGSTTLMPAGTTPTSTTLNTTDLTDLETAYSTNLGERFTAQLTDLLTTNNAVHMYADKLINDHEMSAVQIGMYAAATGTYLPASIQGPDVQTAQTIIGAITGTSGSSSYDRTYLTNMVQSHNMDLQTNRNVVATTDNPFLRALATSDMGTDVVHRNAARILLNGNRQLLGSR